MAAFPKLDKLAKMVERNIEKSVASVRGYFGSNVEPDVEAYESLTFEDFAEMVRQTGPDAVERYVREMEAKRLRRGV